MEEKTYKGSKMGRLKAMVAMGLLSAAILTSPGMVNDVKAAGVMRDVSQQGVVVKKYSKQELAKIQRGIEKFQEQRESMGINNFESSGNSFRDGLRVDNPDSPYYTPHFGDDVHSSVSKSGATIRGNVNIGVINDDRGRW